MKPSYHKDSDAIKETIYQGIADTASSTFLFYTIEFGQRNDTGGLVPTEQWRKYWDKTEVSKTNRLIINKISECFSTKEQPIKFFSFRERHQPTLDKDGDIIKQGRFHLHIISTAVPENAIQEPNRKLRRLIKESEAITNRSDPIQLLNACIRQADWINRYSPAVDIKPIRSLEDLRMVTYYCLKAFKNSGDLDFMDVIDFENSHFN